MANKAGVILEQYKERFEKALMGVRQYSFDSMIVDVALDKYRERLLKARYLLQICMVADRIVDEARLTEYVTRSKMDINDPALSDVYSLMEDNYHNGFNATINKDAIKLKEMITERGRVYLGDTYSSESTDLLLEPINKCAAEIEDDIIDITSSVRRIIDNQKQKERIAILFDKNDAERPRFFVESHENPNDLEYIEASE